MLADNSVVVDLHAILIDDLAELFEQMRGDWAGLAFADDARIHFADRDTFGSGAGQEHFVGDIHFMQRERLFLDRITLAAGNVDDRIARDAFERTEISRRCVDDAILDDEDVVACTFDDISLVVQHERFSRTNQVGLDLRQDVVEIVERLHPWVKRIRQVAARRYADDRQAVLVRLLRVQRELLDDDDNVRFRATSRIEAEIAGTAGYDETDVTVAQSVPANRLDKRLLHLFIGEGNFERDRFRGIIEPVQVLLALEDVAVVDADSLEYAVSIQEAVVIHRDLRILLGYKFAVQINPLLRHRYLHLRMECFI